MASFRSMSFLLALVASAILFPAASPAAQRRDARPAQTSTTLSPKARGELARQFVLKWGGYAERAYKVPVAVWAQRMVPTFVAASPRRFRNALQRGTFEGALSELSNRGIPVSDDSVIARLAGASSKSGLAMKLGDLTRDLVYTPLTPCRIVDTRLAGGAIAANGTRSFRAVNSTDFSGQGGNAGDCGTSGVSAAAVAMNITAVAPGGAGYATAYPYGTTRPLAASVNYATGAIVNNAVIAQIPNPLDTADFTLYSYAQSDYVVDIVGYFAAPPQTALNCTQGFTSANIAANADFNIEAQACAANETRVSVGCRSLGNNQVNWSNTGIYFNNGAACAGTNLTSGQITVQIATRCCSIGYVPD